VPERVIRTGIGPIKVRRQKVRDPLPGSPMHAFDERGGDGPARPVEDPFHLEYPAQMGAAVQKP
jgi:hypothetical protein